MSKTLLSRIKPLAQSKPNPSFAPPFLFETKIKKKLIHQTIHILKTHEGYEQHLETLFAEYDILASDVTHFVLDCVDDAELGLKFFDWASRRSHYFSLNASAYSSLLKLLAKYKVFSEIEDVLKSLKSKEVEPTNEALSSILSAYVDSGLVDKALELYNSVIKVYNRVPTVFSCNALLNLLAKRQKLQIAHQVYDEMLSRGDGVIDCADNYSTCIIVRGLCEEGRIEEGKKLIEARWGKGCIPNIVFYNTLIVGYCKKGDVESADALFKDLKLKGFLPTLSTYGAIINGFCKRGNFEVIDKLLIEMNERGLKVSVQLYNNIIDAQYKFGCVVEVNEALNKMASDGYAPDITTYNTLIKFLCSNRKIKEAKQLLEQAIKMGLIPNKFSYTPLMHLYCKRGEYIKASELVIEMTKGGEKADVVSYGVLIHGLVSAGEVDIAFTIWEKMFEKGVLPDVCVYNMLISGLWKKGRLTPAKLLLSEMLKQKLKPDEFLYTTLVDGFIRIGNLDEAKKLFNCAIENGVEPGIVGYNAMIKGFCKFGMMKDAILFFNRMRKEHYVPDEFTYSTIIDGYIKQNDLNSGLKIYGQMVKQRQSSKPNVVTCTSLISGFCFNKDFDRAEKIFQHIQLHDVKPNVVTYTVLIGSFCKEGKLAKAASFFELMLMNKCIPNNVTFHYLVNGFSNSSCGEISNEVNLFQKNSNCMFMDFFGTMIKDGWSSRSAANNSALFCLCLHGMVKSAIKLSDKMASVGIIPDSVSFAALLYGLCLEGNSEEWKNFIFCNFNGEQLEVAIKYIRKLDQYNVKGKTSEAIHILQTILESYKSSQQDLSNIKEQVR